MLRKNPEIIRQLIALFGRTLGSSLTADNLFDSFDDDADVEEEEFTVSGEDEGRDFYVQSMLMNYAFVLTRLFPRTRVANTVKQKKYYFSGGYISASSPRPSSAGSRKLRQQQLQQQQRKVSVSCFYR